MAAARGQFPKIDGDEYYAHEANLDANAFSNSIIRTLGVTTSSGNVDLSSFSKCNTIRVENIGDVTCFIDLDSTAATTDFPVRPGEFFEFNNVNFDYVSAITAAGTTSLRVEGYEVPGYVGYMDERQILSLSATDASGSVSFTNTTAYKIVVMSNSGTNSVYVTFGATATSANFELKPLTSKVFGVTNQYQIAGICASGLTTTLKILGLY